MQPNLSSVEITFVTYGQSDESQLKLCESDFGGTLTKKGKEQASKLASILKYSDYRVVICSTNPKAIETAQIVFPGKKIPTLSLANGISHGCLTLKPRTLFYESLLASTAPVREFKVKGADSLEMLRRRIMDLFTRLASYLLWHKEDGVLATQKSGNKALVFTSEDFVCEMIEYIKERNQVIQELTQSRMRQTQESELTEEDKLEKSKFVMELSPEELKEYNSNGRLPREKGQKTQKTKVLSVAQDKSSSPMKISQGSFFNDERILKVKAEKRAVPRQFLNQNACSLTKIFVYCPKLDECRAMARKDLNDDYLSYTIKEERSTDHLK